MDEQHDAYREQRKSSLYWLRLGAKELETVDWIEAFMPDLVRRRYRITNLYRYEHGDVHSGGIHLNPVAFEDTVEAADALHADVNKLFNFLVEKCEHLNDVVVSVPIRSLGHAGTISYAFSLTGLPGFEHGLSVEFHGLPAGSACHIVKEVVGTSTVEDVKYSMTCDDDPVVEEGVSVEVD